MLQVISLKRSVGLLVEAHQDRHDFAQVQGTGSLTPLHSLAQQRFSPLGFKRWAEIVDIPEQCF
jgi:hypothetical protein